MRLLNISFLTLGVASAASAHTLDGDASMLEEFGHQIFSTHHLPLIVLAVAAALVIRGALSKNSVDR